MRLCWIRCACVVLFLSALINGTVSVPAAADIHLGAEPKSESKTVSYAIGENEVAGKLTGQFSKSFLANHFLPRKKWTPFPRAADRAAWQSLLKDDLNKTRKKYIIDKADHILGQPWPQLPATLYMEYVRTGNRTHYERPYFRRRENLSVLVLAECMEHKGRFIDEIANGIWAITEEATWCLPAHASRVSGDVLPRQDIETVDLFASETAATLATAYYLLQDELESLSPALCDRLRREVMRRVVDPVDAGHNFGRANWFDGHNNWSPWCASNIFAADLFLEEDPARLVHLTHRLMVVVDRFINRYGADGGCDEGPGYWNEAGGAMIVFLELLNSRTDGATETIYTDPKIAAMGLYITRARLAGRWFANFADASPHSTPHPGKVYRFGERIGSESMKNDALLSMRGYKLDGPVNPPIHLSGVSRPLLGPLMELFWIPASARPIAMAREQDAWLGDVQVLFAHESSKSDMGLALAAKGGYNAESHNHNDVGNFIIVFDGQPAIIDIGSSTYTSKTFSSRRYEIWNIRASAHNMPVVNGVEQAPGHDYRAKDVVFKRSGNDIDLSMDIAPAYPKKAGIKSLIREFTFIRGQSPEISVRDTIEHKTGPVQVELTMYSALPVEKTGAGTLAIDTSPRRLLLNYEPKDVVVAINTVPLTDGRLRSSWGDKLYRIRFDYETRNNPAVHTFRFSAER